MPKRDYELLKKRGCIQIRRYQDSCTKKFYYTIAGISTPKLNYGTGTHASWNQIEKHFDPLRRRKIRYMEWKYCRYEQVSEAMLSAILKGII
jgi:hypothetical protein